MSESAGKERELGQFIRYIPSNVRLPSSQEKYIIFRSVKIGDTTRCDELYKHQQPQERAGHDSRDTETRHDCGSDFDQPLEMFAGGTSSGEMSRNGYRTSKCPKSQQNGRVASFQRHPFPLTSPKKGDGCNRGFSKADDIIMRGTLTTSSRGGQPEKRIKC